MGVINHFSKVRVNGMELFVSTIHCNLEITIAMEYLSKRRLEKFETNTLAPFTLLQVR